MKRSEINEYIAEAKDFFDEYRFKLPPFGHWTVEEFKQHLASADEILHAGLGWDLTDFGSGAFEEKGLLLFTVRNGHYSDNRYKKEYAEKIMIVREEQVTPMHFHWKKAEDIINRGGGNLIIQLYNSTEDEKLADTPITVQMDGVTVHVKAGDTVTLQPGESITLTQGLYHKFWGEAGRGKVLVGEVSAVNDDNADNCFYESCGRFPDIEEDEQPLHLLVSDYAALTA